MEGKRVTIVALDYDRCGKHMAGPTGGSGLARANTEALARLLYESHSAIQDHLLFVSFSNRQSDLINTEYFRNQPRVNLEHLDEAIEILEKRTSRGETHLRTFCLRGLWYECYSMIC